MSIISSVSGLGISTLSVTLNLRSRQKVTPQRYWIGVEVSKWLSQIFSKWSNFFFKYTLPSKLMLNEVWSSAEIPPIQSSKKAKDW